MRGVLAAATALILAALPLPARAVGCEPLEHAGNRYTVCEVRPAREALRTFLYTEDGTPWGQFTAIDNALRPQGRRLAFAMNAGMYHEDRAPVGYYVERGEEEMRVISSAGPGNFGLLPNGILCIRRNRADVIETRAFLRERPSCRYATQSGPMLVIDGALHPRFLPDSSSRYIRNGVGTSEDGTRAVFVISETAVTFHEFASLFRDRLGLQQALFLDGNVSRLYAPEAGRRDIGRTMGPIVGVVARDE
ncbi:phosphodiester glycosidase family protein [Salipiger bermudensis]|uniref:phosphodiester glycosidase family protein n=1 Tax=Salipiger bermudensis TaxID=344736 RepID=UPI001CD1C4F9|nr:phosphodiester glycosidase family protein [Salipiger bermudensis]MCA1284997.1 phosphodiester glycosidase family protein [Salipiger bermudensis]